MDGILVDGNLDGILVDGTFKYCPTFFLQLYTIHGTENGHYMPLVYCLLPNKAQNTYMKMLSIIKDCCTERDLQIKCRTFHADFEKAVHNSIKEHFPGSSVKGCIFHLGQAMWRKIQELGLSKTYVERTSDTSKWLSHTFGLAYLNPEEVEDSFVFDLMPGAPDEDSACDKYADYLLSTYIASDSIFPPDLWASSPENSRRTNNAAEAFQSHYNAQFYAAHPNIYIFLDVISKMQANAYVKTRFVGTPAPKMKREKEKTMKIQGLYDKYRNVELTRADFVKTVSYRCLPPMNL